MSYGAYVHFKNIKKEDVTKFILDIKKAYRSNMEQIAQANIPYSPYSSSTSWRRLDEYILDQATDYFASSAFTAKFAYLDEYQLLAQIGATYRFLDQYYDSTIYFQNSTDQDYEWETWDKIPPFKEIADQTKTMTQEDVIKYYSDDWYDEEGFDDEKLDYYRRSIAYSKIWNSIEERIFDDNHQYIWKICFLADTVDTILFRQKLKVETAKIAVKTAKEFNGGKLVTDTYHPAIDRLAEKILSKSSEK